MSTSLPRAAAILSRIQELSLISDDPNGTTRIYGSPAFLEARMRVQLWMQQAGLKTRIDSIGNLRGRLECEDQHAKTLVIASHIDTVINAGKFDGPLGVIMSIDLVEHLQDPLPFHIELIAFCDEEGVRFHTTFLGSRVVAGSFDKALLHKKDERGIELKEVIIEAGGDPSLIDSDRIDPANWLGYFEIHIEQGPVLYEKNIPVALVCSIAGQKRFEISFSGVAGHAGTVPMSMRNDALCCAAEFILATEKYASENIHSIVATIGKLQIPDAASNVIPGNVICSLDCRSADENILIAAVNRIRNFGEEISKRRNIGFHWTLVQETAPVDCHAPLSAILDRSIKDSGLECITLISGAGHDAVPISAIAPVAMLFVRCFKGISHNPLEDVEIQDIAAAIRVADGFLHQLSQNNDPL